MTKRPSIKGIDVFLPQTQNQTQEQQNKEEQIKQALRNEYKYIHKYKDLGLKQTAFWLTTKAIKTLKLYALKYDKTQSEVVEELILKYCKLPENTTAEKIVNE